MTNVTLSLASPRAANPVQAFAPAPAFTPAPAAPATLPGVPAVERQQAIENALTMALYFIRQPHSDTTLQAATTRAIRAASMLKQACTDSTTSGRA